MKRPILIILLFFFFPHFISSQQLRPLKEFIQAWETTGITQTQKAFPYFSQLDYLRDTVMFDSLMNVLYGYLNKHPSKRLQTRIEMFDAVSRISFLQTTGIAVEKAQHAMKLAMELKDDQLLAEIYPICAFFKSGEEALVYNLKALQIRKRIGYQYFLKMQTLLFSVSNSLYISGNYKQAIHFGLEGLVYRYLDKKSWEAKFYIMQLDILGASYKKIKQYDSAAYYNQQITNYCLAHPNVGDAKLWLAISRGNLGYARIKQGHYNGTKPLIDEHLKVSTALKDTLNMSMANVALSWYFFHTKNLTSAVNCAKNSLHFANVVNNQDLAEEACELLSLSYKGLGNVDSVYYYANQYANYKDSINNRINRNLLNSASAQVAFDKLQSSFTTTEMQLSKVRVTRNLVLVGIVMFGAIIMLLYSRKLQGNKLKLQDLQLQQEKAMHEMAEAKSTVESFTQSIIEKNELIITLQNKLKVNATPGEEETIPKELLKYTLLTNDGWNKFRENFSKAYPAFFDTLYFKTKGKATPAMERLAALIFLNINNFQIANTLGISKESVSRSKRRLKILLDLRLEDNLDDIIRYFL